MKIYRVERVHGNIRSRTIESIKVATNIHDLERYIEQRAPASVNF